MIGEEHSTENPIAIFEDRRSFLDDSVFRGVFGATSFHDATLDQSLLHENGVALRLRNIWFGQTLGYDAFFTKGAELRLVFDKVPSDSVRLLIRNLSDRNVYGLEYDPDRCVLSISVTDIYDLDFSIDPAQSQFEWLFQPIESLSA